jgi:hypothetical protein
LEEVFAPKDAARLQAERMFLPSAEDIGTLTDISNRPKGAEEYEVNYLHTKS